MTWFSIALWAQKSPWYEEYAYPDVGWVLTEMNEVAVPTAYVRVDRWSIKVTFQRDRKRRNIMSSMTRMTPELLCTPFRIPVCTTKLTIARRAFGAYRPRTFFSRTLSRHNASTLKSNNRPENKMITTKKFNKMPVVRRIMHSPHAQSSVPSIQWTTLLFVRLFWRYFNTNKSACTYGRKEQKEVPTRVFYTCGWSNHRLLRTQRVWVRGICVCVCVCVCRRHSPEMMSTHGWRR